MTRLLTLAAVVGFTPLARADEPASFTRDVIPALNVGGCNGGACHGSPGGRGGFRLSLRGHDPDADYLTLTRELDGRRTSRIDPGSSLLLLKPLGRVPHGGGVRFGPDSAPAKALRDWMAQGMPRDAKPLAVTKLEVLPTSRLLQPPTRQQQLTVIAHHADGSKRDVTPLTVFTSNDPCATINPTGLVTFDGPGEAAILCRYQLEMQTARLTYLEPKANFTWVGPAEANFVDRHVFEKLKTMQILPSETCSDTAFLRRAHLDLCGIVPTAAETKAFLADTDPKKREKLIDQLLDRPDHADFWTLKWLDVFRNSRRNLGTESAAAYQAWVRENVRKNTPVDRMVRELLTATGNSSENAPANYFRIDRTPEELGESTAQLFCGVRVQCAQCHNHPWERWTQDDYFGLAAFFAQVGRTGPDGKKAKKGDPEVITTGAKAEVLHPRSKSPVAPRFLGGSAPAIPAGGDRREALAGWLVSTDNPFFARATVNRIWFHLMGRGIVDPVDDFRDSNPPSNDALLDALARDFVASKYDARHVIRSVMLSQTYQRSSRTNESNEKDVKYFSHAAPRLLTGEQLLDSIGRVMETPEFFKGTKTGTRAIQLPDGEDRHPFLRAFGQPARQTPCECERDSGASLARALQMVNGPTINSMVANPKNRIGRLLAKNRPDRETLDELYWATVARGPTEAEANEALGHVKAAVNRRQAWEDVQWALLNTREFLYRY